MKESKTGNQRFPVKTSFGKAKQVLFTPHSIHISFSHYNAKLKIDCKTARISVRHSPTSREFFTPVLYALALQSTLKKSTKRLECEK